MKNKFVCLTFIMLFSIYNINAQGVANTLNAENTINTQNEENTSKSRSVINGIKVAPLNRALITITGQITHFSSELSTDKQNISLNLYKTKIGNTQFPITSNGIISHISASSQNSDLTKLQFQLTDKRGYSAFYLPMSNSICIEVFDWAKLSQSEDSYRSALLALEEGIYSSAKDYLIQSASKELPNSAAMLGLIYMMEGNIPEALKYLHLASENNTNIPDAYSALAQYYTQQGDTKKAAGYKNLYTEFSGLKSYLPIQIGALKPENINQNDSLSFLSYGVINNSENLRTDTNRTADSNAAKAQRPKATTTNSKTETSMITNILDWISPTVFYVIFGLVLFIIMLFSTYMKWRKKQIELINQFNTKPQNSNVARASKFDSELQKAEISPAKPKIHSAINKYMANEINQSPKTTKKTNQFADTYAENSGQVQNLARIILDNQKNQQTPSKSSLLPKGQEKSKNPNLDLAISLQKKQQNIKSKNIENIKSEDLQSDRNQELSKKLGIPPSALDTKKKINDLESNQDQLNKLADKFRQK